MNIDFIFKSYYRPLCLYAMHYLSGNMEQAEDIVQDCFLKLWQHQAEHPKAFLYMSVRNACIDYLRRQKTHAVDMVPQDLDGYISDEEAQERSFREAALWTAIDALPEGCRNILLMSKRDGMKYKEIAAELGISERTVEHQMSKALKRLKGKSGDFFFLMFCMG